MQRHRLHIFAALLLTLAIGQASAQRQAQQTQPAQQQGQQGGQQVQGAQQAQPQAPPAPQPIYIVPAPQTPAPPAAPRVNPDLPTVELAPLLQRVERASDKRFLVDVRHGPRIYLGGVEPDDVTYPVLLAIFRLNGFAAFESGGFVNIVPDANIRFHETRIAQTDDASIPAEEFVTRVLAPKNIQATMLVPILRPLMPQSAHLAAHSDSNQLILMDRYANVQRITAIVRSLDVASPRPNQ